MKRLLLAASIALLSLSSTAVLAAHGHGGDADKHGNGGDHGHSRGESDNHDRNGNHGHGRDEPSRHAEHWDQRPRHGDYDKHGRRWAYARRHRAHYDNGLHLGQRKQAFRRGQHVPVVYLQPRYYVQDYRAYNLAAPPYGYRWVRPDNNRYLLISTATGLISQILGY